MNRTVILLCGPPGAGKSSYARELAAERDLTVFDGDDTRWVSERQFNQALRRIGRDPKARAVVIRAGANRSARARTAGIIEATETKMLLADEQTCIERVTARKRGPARREVAAVRDWWRRYEPEQRHSRDW